MIALMAELLVLFIMYFWYEAIRYDIIIHYYGTIYTTNPRLPHTRNFDTKDSPHDLRYSYTTRGQ